MSEELPYEVLDVFTTQRYAGNPLAVVKLLERDITQTQKQRIAKEFNLSETVFWRRYGDQSSGTKIDVFTPEAEIPFAGHPTIGSAICVLDHARVTSSTLLMKAGKLQIHRSDDGYTYASIPHNAHHHVVRPREGAVPVSIVLGMTFILVELPSREALAAQSTEVPLSIKDLDDGWQEGLVGTYYYCKDAAGRGENDYCCRMFTSFDSSGIEDAATGSAACTLATYLSHLQPHRESMQFRITQGVEMGRPSEILVRTTRRDGKLVEVVLGGQATRIMKGSLLL